jgi:hypothetical protein
VLIVPMDLGAVLSLDHGHAWVGFTAATGGDYENHDILSWSFQRTLREICNDGLDNDGNGLIDAADPQCQSRKPLQLSLSPSADVGLLTSPHTLTARVTDSDGNPQAGVFVWFQAAGVDFVSSGQLISQNAGCNPADCRSDQNGEVQWKYWGSGYPGFDSITASAYDAPYRTQLQSYATQEWQAPPPPPPGNGNGLLGVYYDNIDFTGPSISRIDPQIAFDWGTDSPDPAIGPDTFSVRWTGEVEPQFTQPYTFTGRTDDGMRVWVDGQLIIDAFYDQPPTYHNGTISLFAGKRYKIQIDYYENRIGAVAMLFWSGPATPFDFVPQTQLYSPCQIICPTNFAVCNDPGTCSAVVNYTTPTAVGDCGTITCNPPSGAQFPTGPTLVTCSEPAGTLCSFTVTVTDCEAPKMSSSVATKSLSPDSLDLINVGFQAQALDNCDGPITPASIQVQVFSDEDELPPGTGPFSPDAKNLTATGNLRLRAERSANGDGRVYLIVAKATDKAGNTGFCVSTVTVPHDSGAKSISSVVTQANAAAAYATAHKGAPPPGYFQIGNGPIVGAKQ